MAAGGRYRVPVFPRLTRLLAETAVDAVIVATTNGDKAAAIQEAMRAGKHVIAHAPCAITQEQLDAVTEAQASSGTGLVLLLPLRFTPAYVHLRAAIMQGQLGDISQAMIINSQKVTATPRTQAFYATRTHGGILTNLAVHDLDVLRWIGGEVTVTSAATQCHGLTEHPEFEDGRHRALYARIWWDRRGGVQLACAGRRRSFPRNYRDRYCRHGVDKRRKASRARSRCGRHPA